MHWCPEHLFQSARSTHCEKMHKDICIHTCAYAQICTRTHICIHDIAQHAEAPLLRLTIYAQIFIRIHIHTYIRAYIYIYMYTCIYIYIYMSVHIRTYTYHGALCQDTCFLRRSLKQDFTNKKKKISGRCDEIEYLLETLCHLMASCDK